MLRIRPAAGCLGGGGDLAVQRPAAAAPPGPSATDVKSDPHLPGLQASGSCCRLNREQPHRLHWPPTPASRPENEP